MEMCMCGRDRAGVLGGPEAETVQEYYVYVSNDRKEYKMERRCNTSFKSFASFDFAVVAFSKGVYSISPCFGGYVPTPLTHALVLPLLVTRMQEIEAHKSHVQHPYLHLVILTCLSARV